jgi:hypothetical protein
MASERQIAANRRNARNSTGPRSSAGKSRASRNAYRHGLSVGVSAPLAPRLEIRARKIAGNSDDALTLEAAREVVQAELDLAQVRRAKVALIERARAFGTADRPRGSVGYVDDVLNATVGSGSALSELIASAPMMLSPAPEQSAQATRRVLPTLGRLDRYERRAVARRDRAVVQLGRASRNLKLYNLQNEANLVPSSQGVSYVSLPG